MRCVSGPLRTAIIVTLLSACTAVVVDSGVSLRAVSIEQRDEWRTHAESVSAVEQLDEAASGLSIAALGSAGRRDRVTPTQRNALITNLNTAAQRVADATDQVDEILDAGPIRKSLRVSAREVIASASSVIEVLTSNDLSSLDRRVQRLTDARRAFASTTASALEQSRAVLDSRLAALDARAEGVASFAATALCVGFACIIVLVLLNAVYSARTLAMLRIAVSSIAQNERPIRIDVRGSGAFARLSESLESLVGRVERRRRDANKQLSDLRRPTLRPTEAKNVVDNLAQLDPGVDPLLRAALETAVANQVPIAPSSVVFTDERAPVETIIDSLVLRYLLEAGPAGLPGLEQ